MPVADTLGCECGVDFREYVRRALSEPFPYSGIDPAERVVTDLWPGRRLVVKAAADGEWRAGSIKQFEQFNMGPCRTTPRPTGR